MIVHADTGPDSSWWYHLGCMAVVRLDTVTTCCTVCIDQRTQVLESASPIFSTLEAKQPTPVYRLFSCIQAFLGRLWLGHFAVRIVM